MKIIFENENIVCKYKPHNVHTLEVKDAREDESLALYRLDKATAGILVFAKSEEYLSYLKDLQKKGKIIKTYRARIERDEKNELVCEEVAFALDKKLPLVVSSYFRPFGEGRKAVRAVFEGDLKRYKDKDISKELYKTYFKEFRDDVIICAIKKGFRHQIRVHLATMGYPIVNDSLYKAPYEVSDNIELECIEVNLDGLCISCKEMQQQP